MVVGTPNQYCMAWPYKRDHSVYLVHYSFSIPSSAQTCSSEVQNSIFPAVRMGQVIKYSNVTFMCSLIKIRSHGGKPTILRLSINLMTKISARNTYYDINTTRTYFFLSHFPCL